MPVIGNNHIQYALLLLLLLLLLYNTIIFRTNWQMHYACHIQIWNYFLKENDNICREWEVFLIPVFEIKYLLCIQSI